MVEITYERKKYRFSTWSLVLFPAGTILLALGLYFGTEAWFGEWIHWFVASQTSWILKLFGINVDIMEIKPPITFDGRTVWWRFVGDIPSSIYFTHDCSGFQAIAIFLALILFTPHSQDKEANAGIWRRKGVSMAVSSLLFHVVNVIRMVIQISLYHAGLPWDSIHYSISAASSIIAAIIIILMNRWIPEFVIAIMVMGRNIGNIFKRPKENLFSIGKIVNKEQFLTDDLIPSNIKEVIKGRGNYFLLIFLSRKDLVKASFYPCSDAHVEKILIKLQKFSPERVQEISGVFNNLQLREHVLHTTGLCYSSAACFYETYVHLSPDGNLSRDAIKQAFLQVPGVLDVSITPLPFEEGNVKPAPGQVPSRSLDFA